MHLFAHSNRDPVLFGDTIYLNFTSRRHQTIATAVKQLVRWQAVSRQISPLATASPLEIYLTTSTINHLLHGNKLILNTAATLRRIFLSDVLGPTFRVASFNC